MSDFLQAQLEAHLFFSRSVSAFRRQAVACLLAKLYAETAEGKA